MSTPKWGHSLNFDMLCRPYPLCNQDIPSAIGNPLNATFQRKFNHPNQMKYRFQTIKIMLMHVDVSCETSFETTPHSIFMRHSAVPSAHVHCHLCAWPLLHIGAHHLVILWNLDVIPRANPANNMSSHFKQGCDNNPQLTCPNLYERPNVVQTKMWVEASSRVSTSTNNEWLQNQNPCLGPVYTTVEKASGWSRILGQDMVIWGKWWMCRRRIKGNKIFL